MTSGFGIQDGIVAALTLLALAWLVRRRVRRRARPTPLCEECPGCAPARGAARVPAPVRRDDLIPISRITGRRD
jgi:hypothetical protein